MKTEPGQTLDNRFRLVREIGRGGMSILYLADDSTSGGQVVVKVPLPVFSSGVGAWSIFQQEEEIGRRLDHPGIVKFLTATDGKRRPYVVMEYVSGQTLSDVLASDGVLDEARALSIASRLCSALEHMHARGFVHYDLKPANVMICPNGGIRLIDFGLAHAAVAGKFSFSAAPPPIASAAYIAPEQIQRKRGRKSVDIYGVGAILYEMLTGKVPFPDDDPFTVGSARLIGDPTAPRRLNPKISAQTEEIILHALRRDPEQRYASVTALRAELERPELVAVSGLAEHLQPPTAWRRRWRKARYVLVVAGLPLLAQIVIFALLWRRFSHR